MRIPPALTIGLLSGLYLALALRSLQAIEPVLPAPAMVWMLGGGLAGGGLVALLLRLFRARPAQAPSRLQWLLLVNAALLLLVMWLELPAPGGIP